MQNEGMHTQASRDTRTHEALARPAAREVAYLLLRVTLGLVFLTTGVQKLIAGVGGFAASLLQAFAGKLPAALVAPFAYALPFLEVALGALLLLGMFNEVGLALAGLLIVALTFGKVVEGDSATVAHNLSYALIIFALLWLADHNRFSVDTVLRRRPPGE